MVGLVDCNNFFVSCERTICPHLEGKAVIVLSNNDGCAIARSNEAKALGVKMGQPAFQLRDMINSGQIIAISSNHKLYYEISVRMHKIFRRYVPSTFDYSVDEAFLDFEGIPNEALLGIAQNIRDACMIEENIPVSLGISHTHTLAKIATHIGKKLTSSICVLDNKKEIREILEKTPIYDLWGIGRRLSKRLYYEGINTIADFSNLNINYVRSAYGINGERIWNELHCIPCIKLNTSVLQESMSETRTFSHDTDNYEYIRSQIVMFAVNCSIRLRRMKGACKVVSVFISTNRFKDTQDYQSFHVNICFEAYESSSSLIVKAAEQGLMKIFDSSLKYKRAGVILSSIVSSECRQLTLFDENIYTTKKEEERLSNVIDNINKNNRGETIVKLASQLTHESSQSFLNGYTSTFHFQE